MVSWNKAHLIRFTTLNDSNMDKYLYYIISIDTPRQKWSPLQVSSTWKFLGHVTRALC